MPLGNSITQGDMHHRTYRYHLWKMLRKNGYDVDFVGTVHTNFNGVNSTQDFDQDHEGHSGWRADQVLNGIPGQRKLSDFVHDTSPDIVLMHLGSNDIFQGEPVDQIITELKDIIMNLRSSNADIIVLIAQILPVADRVVSERIMLLNRAIAELPASMGLPSQLIVVNQFDGFDPYKDTYDGVHPNGPGEKKMADKWYKALQPVMKK